MAMVQLVAPASVGHTRRRGVLDRRTSASASIAQADDAARTSRSRCAQGQRPRRNHGFGGQRYVTAQQRRDVSEDLRKGIHEPLGLPAVARHAELDAVVLQARNAPRIRTRHTGGAAYAVS